MGRELTTSSTGTAETSNGSFDAVLGNGLVGGKEHSNGHGLVAVGAVEAGNGHERVAGGGLGAIGDGGPGGKRTIGSTSGVLRNNTGFVSI